MRADLGRRGAYDERAKDRDRRRGDLERQRERVATELATICTDVHAGRRRMNQLTLEAVGQAARRLAELDEALRVEGG